jgi:zinc/manganese transport system substrate-binding protein
MSAPVRDRLAWLALACAALLLPASARGAAPAVLPAKLRVVATIPDLADVAREIGGERVDVTSLTQGRENLHRVSARPSHLVALSRADVLVQIGLSLEVGFLPGLLENARNGRIRPGAPGFIRCSEGWQALDVPATVTRREGDVHPEGNPHINLDPTAGRHIAGRVLAGLVAADPAGRAEYERGAQAYLERLGQAEERWALASKPWKGRKVVVYHTEFDYLVRRVGLEVVGSIEDKPGIPPTPGHVAELVARMKSAGEVVLLTAPWSNGGEVQQIAKATGARVVELPNQCGGLPGAESWIGMMDLVHARLAQAFGNAGGAR